MSLTHLHLNHLRPPALLLALALLLAPLLGLAATPAQAASGDCTTTNGQTICTFEYTGAAQTWTVPDGVTAAIFDVYGAQGGNGIFTFAGSQFGGRGGEAKATLAVTPNQTFQINVGGAGGDVTLGATTAGAGGFGGGGNGGNGGLFDTVFTIEGGGGGGGASDVRSGGFSPNERIIVAGGGGGAGGGAGGLDGGAGGGTSGLNGGSSGSPLGPRGGAGGSPTVGGAGGAGGTSSFGGASGTSGSFGSGGVGASLGGSGGGAGGGGGGYYGGGGGGTTNVGTASAAGGGGSGFGPAGVAFQTGVREGHGLVVITYPPDASAPTASPTQSPAANGNWNNSDVTVSWNWADDAGGSGIDSANCASSSISSGEGAQTLSASCKDLAGNQGSASYAVNVDKTAPTISAAAMGSPNANGWYNSPLTVQFSCDDTLSGVASCPADQALSAEGASVSSSAQTTSDNAGNTSAPSNIVTVQIDRSAPAVSVTGVTNGASYPLGSVPAAGCSTSDALSSVATQAALSITGGNPDGTGSFTATCSGATDKAGNPGSASVSYTVVYRWSGFAQPVDNLPTVNSVKAGSAVPVKFSLGGNYGLNIFAAGYPKVQVVACSGGVPTDEVEQTVTAGASGLSYDAASGQYKYTWKTDKSWAGSCRQLVLKLADGSEHIAGFKFK